MNIYDPSYYYDNYEFYVQPSDVLYIGTFGVPINIDASVNVNELHIEHTLRIDDRVRVGVESQFDDPVNFMSVQSFNQSQYSRLVIPVGYNKYATTQQMYEPDTSPFNPNEIDVSRFSPENLHPRSVKPIILPIIQMISNVDYNWKVEGCRLIFEQPVLSHGPERRYVNGIIVANNAKYTPGTVFGRRVNTDKTDENTNLYYVCENHHIHQLILCDIADSPYPTYEYPDGYASQYRSHVVANFGGYTLFGTTSFPLSMRHVLTNEYIDCVLGFANMIASNALKMCYSPATNELSQENINIADPNFNPTAITIGDPIAGSVMVVPDDPAFGRYQLEFSNGYQYVKYDDQAHIGEVYNANDITIGLTITSYMEEQPMVINDNTNIYGANYYSIYSFGEKLMTDGSYSGHQLYLVEQYGRTYLALQVTLDQTDNNQFYQYEYRSFVSELGIYEQCSYPDEGRGWLIVGFRIQPNIGHSVLIRQYRNTVYNTGSWPQRNQTLGRLWGITTDMTDYAIEFGVDGNFIRIAYPQNLLRGLNSQQNFSDNTLPPIILGYQQSLDMESFIGKIGRFQVQPSFQNFLVEDSWSEMYLPGTQLIMPTGFTWSVAT